MVANTHVTSNNQTECFISLYIRVLLGQFKKIVGQKAVSIEDLNSL